MKGLGMAVVATLAPLLAVAADSLVSNHTQGEDHVDSTEPPLVSGNGKEQTVNCKAKAKAEVTVSVPNSTVIVECQENSQFDPPVGNKTVYNDKLCQNAQQLSALGPKVSIAALENDKKSSGPQDQTGPGGQAGGVQICAQLGGSISLRIPDKDSSVQFKCTEEFTLYPTEPNRVFGDDCKTEENLKDMTRTQETVSKAALGTVGRETSAASPVIYTLKADKKPPKKRLCYLCAKQKPGDTTAQPAANYCAVYVESSAPIKFALGLDPWAVMLPCVLAVLRFP